MSTFQEKLEQRRRELAEKKEAEAPDDVIPVLPKKSRPEDLQLEAILGSITIDQAYKRWCNKSPVPSTRQREGLKVSCPNPSHPDTNPSAWLNLDKGLWNCGACEMGGDKYDIAAWNFGYSVPHYKTEHFKELRERMAGDLGYTKYTSGGTVSYSKTEPNEDSTDNSDLEPIATHTDTSSPKSIPKTPQDITDNKDKPTPIDVTSLPGSTEAKLAKVVELFDEAEEDIYVFPPILWKDIVPPDTFLWHWMEITTADDVPEEYHFWNGLVAIAMALGRDVTLYDRIPVYGNLFICTVGHSGDGKSQSRGHLAALLSRTLPYKHSDPNSKGVRKIKTPGSAEVLIQQFSKPIMDPTDPKKIAYYAPVRGIIDFNELSAFAGRAGRTGSVLKPVLMEFYDNERYISTASVTHGTKEAQDAYACVTTTTQPKAFKDLMNKSDIDSGFLNRWLFVGGVPKIRVPIGGVKCDTSPCDVYLNQIVAWAGKAREITWDDDAAAVFTDFFHKILQPAKLRDETGLLVRIDLTLKKLCLLLTANSRLNSVPLWVVEKVVVLYKYLVECYTLSNTAINNTLTSEIAQEILRHVVRITAANGGKGASIRELGQRMKRKNYPRDQVIKLLKHMVDLGELEQELFQPKRGPATVRYKNVD